MSSLLLRAAAGACVLAAALPAVALGQQRPSFDIQAHRGGIGLRSENTLASFGNAMRLGVSTLELDVQITKDNVAVITHDRKLDPSKCQDTGPVTPGDPAYPYVGRLVKDLTLAQVQTIDCGYRQLAGFPDQENVPGIRMPTLMQVFNLVKRYHSPVRLNVEPKVEAGSPTETAPQEEFVRDVVRDVRAAGFIRRVTI